MGAVNNETLVGAYRIADLYIMPSTGEGFGIAYLEAMASGTPALGLGVAGACDALADGELGSCVAETELGEAIAKRLEMPRSDPQVLASAVEARFGREAFRARARGILDALKAAA
jgi:phosphatidylinositol alpha-1,6-mannosyltransferase